MLRSDGVTKFYVNGIQTANTESSTPLAPTAFTIGSATRGRFFDGMIDDVRIYNRALSASEIQAIYTEQKIMAQCSTKGNRPATWRKLDGCLRSATDKIYG